jgi:hypothetical protein
MNIIARTNNMQYVPASKREARAARRGVSSATSLDSFASSVKLSSLREEGGREKGGREEGREGESKEGERKGV